MSSTQQSQQSQQSLQPSQSLSQSFQTHEEEFESSSTLTASEAHGFIPGFPLHKEESETTGDSSNSRPTLSRHSSHHSRFSAVLETPYQKIRAARRELSLLFLRKYAIIGVLIMCIFSIYWGASYQRFSRLKNLEMLVVIDDDTVPAGFQTFGDRMVQLLETPAARYYGHWNVFNYTTYNALASSHNRTIEQQIEVDIHHQRYWSSIYVRRNATGNWYQALQRADASYTTVNNTISSIYETGRDFINMDEYVTSGIQSVALLWQAVVSDVTDPLVNSLSTAEKSALAGSQGTLALLNTPISFQYIDRIPWTDPVLAAPSQVGLLYMIILSFFNVGFFQDLHRVVDTYHLKRHHYISYRVASSTLSYFWLSLMYSLVSLAMQVDFTVAFGRSGFLVFWMMSYMTMYVVGMVSELAMMWIPLVDPQLMGFWLIFWVYVNITPTFTPLALSPKFYRYGYAIPLHSASEITKVVFFNTYKGQLGRDFGILAGWCVLCTLLLIASLCALHKINLKKAAKAAEAAREAEKA